MKIRKFNEKYKLDLEDDIGTEYAKYIISKFIDKENDGASIESIYKEVIEDEDLDEHQAEIVKYMIETWLSNTLKFAKKIRPLFQIDSDKYNL